VPNYFELEIKDLAAFISFTSHSVTHKSPMQSPLKVVSGTRAKVRILGTLPRCPQTGNSL